MEVRGDKTDQRCGQIPIEFFCCSRHGQGRRQCKVLAILELLRDDVHANLVIVDVGDGQQEGALRR